MECGRTVIGGETDENDRYIEPTVLVDITPSDPIMKEEVKNAFKPDADNDFCRQIDSGLDGCFQQNLVVYMSPQIGITDRLAGNINLKLNRSTKIVVYAPGFIDIKMISLYPAINRR